MNAYERENAQEWQMHAGGAIQINRDYFDDDQDDEDDEEVMHGPHPSLLATPNPVRQFDPAKPPQRLGTSVVKNIRQIIRFNVEGDNGARAAWRSRKPHNDSYRLPKDYHHMVLDQIKNSRQNTDLNPLQLSSVLEAIGTRTGSHIRPPSTVRDSDLLIWGNNSQVKAAKEALDEWFRRLRRLTVPHTGRAMPSVHPITSKQRKDYEIRLSEAAQKQSFRQEPESETTFAVTGAYIWSLNQIRPEDMLGANYEALDPIRMYHNCYIVYDRKLLVFKVLSNIFLDVDGAIESLDNAICELAARSSIPFEKYLVAPPSPHVEQTNVKMLDAPWHTENGRRIEKQPVFVKVGSRPCHNAKPPKGHDDLVKRNQELMQKTTLRCLSRMRYYRGRVLMRIYIGTFTLNKFRWIPKNASSIPFEEFAESMRLPGTKGTLKQVPPSTGDADGLFSRTCQAGHLVEPIDAHTRDLLDVTPLSVAFFTFQRGEHGQMKLLVETAPTLGDDYLVEVTQRKWSRIDNSGSVPLQLFMIRLEGGVTWKLQISTENTIDAARLTPAMADFADSIHYRATKEEIGTPGKPLFTFRPVAGLIEFIQKTMWRYRLASHSAYVFEVARYESFDIKDKKLLRTHWGGSIFNEAWDQILAGNSALRMGAVGIWNPSLDVFFPKNDTQTHESNNGFGELLVILQSVIEFLSEEKQR